MNPIPPAVTELFGDPEGKRAEECLLKVLTDLEAAGVNPKALAQALSRVMLGFCAEHGKHAEKYGWAVLILGATGDALRRQAAHARRRWVEKFLARTGRLYADAAAGIRMERLQPPIPPVLQMGKPEGHA